MEITTKPFVFLFCFFSFFLHTWLYLLMTPALIMLVIPGLPSYNGVEVYYLKGVIGLPIVISFRDRGYIHFFFWKWAHWWRHHHRLDRFRFKNFQSPGFYSPVNPLGPCCAWSVHLSTPFSWTGLVLQTEAVNQYLCTCTFFSQKLITVHLESAERREWP